MRYPKPIAQSALAILCLTLAHCGSLSQLGSSEGASSSTSSSDSTMVTVSGSLEGSASSITKAVSNGGCLGDTVVATDNEGEVIDGEVDSDCGFALGLDVGGIYTFAIMLDGEYVASFSFQNDNDGFAMSSLRMMLGMQTLALGPIHLVDGVGVPTYQPLQQFDSDADGTSDYDDEDDDGDGTSDEEEEDCDLDGTPDDMDGTIDCDDASTVSSAGASLARILAVRPRHYRFCQEYADHPLLRFWCHRIRLERPVTAWFSCRIDKDSVNAETFRVATLDGEAIGCHYRYKKWGWRFWKRAHHHVVRCLHYDDPFAGDTVYVTTINGVQCQDGRAVRPGRAAFLTRHDDFYTCDENDEIEVSEDVEDDDESEADAGDDE